MIMKTTLLVLGVLNLLGASSDVYFFVVKNDPLFLAVAVFCFGVAIMCFIVSRD